MGSGSPHVVPDPRHSRLTGRRAPVLYEMKTRERDLLLGCSRNRPRRKGRGVSEDRIHRVVSHDGTELAARVHGQGPPLLLLPAGPGNSETTWRSLVPLLSERFTCYLVNTRGRGMSEDHPDHAPARLAEDVKAFADSIDAPVGVAEWGSCSWALVTADSGTSIAAVAAYESGAVEMLTDEAAARLEEAFARVAELVEQDRLVEAARSFVAESDVIYTDEDLADGAPSEFWEAAAPNLPIFLREEEAAEADPSSPTDPSVLEQVDVPVLVLQGTRTRPWFVDSTKHIAEHLTTPVVREIPGAAHFGPYRQPQAIANELIRFFTARLRSTTVR